MKTILLIALAAVALAITACGTVAEPLYREAQTAVAETSAEEKTIQEAAFDEELYQRGIQLYLENYCGSCHALAAAETWGNFGPSHDQAALHAQERLDDPTYDGEATTPEEYLRESILNPQQYFVPTYAGSPHRMPAYTNLSEDEVDAIVYMLLQQR